MSIGLKIVVVPIFLLVQAKGMAQDAGNEVAVPKEGKIFRGTIFLGISMPADAFGNSGNPPVRTIGSGPVFGVEAGFEFWPGIRWLSTAAYSVHTISTDPSVRAIDGVVAPETKGKFTSFLTGGELHSVNTSGVRVRMFGQFGILTYGEAGYVLPIPQTINHPAGNVTVQDNSVTAILFCAGGGATTGRFGIDVRWVICRPQYNRSIVIDYAGGGGRRIDSIENHTGHQIIFTLDYSIL